MVFWLTAACTDRHAPEQGSHLLGDTHRWSIRSALKRRKRAILPGRGPLSSMSPSRLTCSDGAHRHLFKVKLSESQWTGIKGRVRSVKRRATESSQRPPERRRKNASPMNNSSLSRLGEEFARLGELSASWSPLHPAPILTIVYLVCSPPDC